MIQIVHNPRCGKSRSCVALVANAKIPFEEIQYLKSNFTFEELSRIIAKLAIKPMDLVRQKEKIWIANFKNKPLSDMEIINAMVTNPILIERPIVIDNDKAILGRDLEQVAAFIA